LTYASEVSSPVYQTYQPLYGAMWARALETHQGEDSGMLVPSSDLKRLGDEAYAAGEYERALDYYNTAAAYAKLDNLLVYAELYQARGKTHAALSQWPEALSDAERAAGIRPIWLPAALSQAEVRHTLCRRERGGGGRPRANTCDAAVSQLKRVRCDAR